MAKAEKKIRKDLGDLDGALCKWLGDRLMALVESDTFGVDTWAIAEMRADGWQGDGEWDYDRFDHVFKLLTKISANALLDYSTRYDLDLSDEGKQCIFDEAREALKWVAKYLPALSL
jgi:hypothetical protein